MRRLKGYFSNLVFPAIIFGSITGLFTAVVVVLYKLLAKIVIGFSQNYYSFLRGKLYFIPLVLIVFYFMAVMFSRIYKRQPRVKGGGIPSSIALLRNIVTFKWLRTLIGVFFISLSSFLVGVPLGNEGPSVLMGTAVGKGSVMTLAKKHPAWSGYSMTGGACAGFAVATGASVSGLLFAIEEAHQKLSPMILIVGSVAVLFAQLLSSILCPLLGLSTAIFPTMAITTLAIKDVWIPVLVGAVIGLFAVAFLKYYHLISNIFNRKLKKVPHHVKIFLVYALTLVFGLVSFSFISTGHEIFPLLLEGKVAILGLIVLLLVRMSLTLFANTNKLTGGVFIPIMALGAIMASIIGKSVQLAFGLGNDYLTVILVLGISACIASMMKMPLTAVVFSLEALGCGNNVIHVIIVVAVSFIITEIFGVKGINDGIIDNIVRSQEETHKRLVIDTHITIQKGSFAEFRHVKDIIWPSNFFLLSIIPSKSRRALIDQEGSMTLHEGDVLHIRYATFDEEHTKKELVSIVGEQDYDETETMNE